MADENKKEMTEEMPEVYEKDGFWTTVTKAAAKTKVGQWFKNHKGILKIAAIGGALLGGAKIAGDWKEGRGLFAKNQDWSGEATIEDYSPDPALSGQIQDISWEQSAEE